MPDDLEARVPIVVGDDISTGGMAADGAIAMSVWSNIALCVQFLLTRFDTAFQDRAVEWGSGVIVAGDKRQPRKGPTDPRQGPVYPT